MNAFRRLFSETREFSRICRPFSVSSTLSERVLGYKSLVKHGIVARPDKTVSAGEADQVSVNVSALASVKNTFEGFQLYPDETTADTEYYGIKYRNLPYVSMVCKKNNTKVSAFDAKDKFLFYSSPKMYGFRNANKRTEVANVTTGINMGQNLRNVGIRSVRVQMNGFNLGRVAVLKGLVQSGINVVSVTDVTYVDWGWSKRAKKRRRV